MSIVNSIDDYLRFQRRTYINRARLGGGVSSSNTSQVAQSIILPSAISGLAAWIDATDAASITNVSGAASQINDKSGNGNHLAQATSANRPLIVATGGQNNLGYLNFDTTAKTIGLASFAISQPYTVFMVMRQKGYIANRKLLDFASLVGISYGSTIDIGLGRGVASSLGLVAGSQYTHPYTQYNLTAALNVWIPFQAYFSDADSYLGMYGLGGDQLTASPGTTAGTQLFINTLVTQDFHELIIYNRQLTANEGQSICQYLQAKYLFPTKTYLMSFGDSITTGLNATTSSGWATGYIQLVAAERAYNYNTLYAEGGQTLATIMTKYIPRAVRSLRTGKITIMLGQNDGNLSGGALATWKAAYAGYIQQLLDAGFPAGNIILLSTPPTVTPTNTGLKVATSELAITYGTQYVDTWQYINDRVVASYTAGDGIHPNTTGHRNMADILETASI